MATAVRTVDVSAIINGRRLTGFNYQLVVLSWLITVFDGFDMMMVGFTAPFMRDEFGLSKMMLGRVFSAGLLGMMLGGARQFVRGAARVAIPRWPRHRRHAASTPRARCATML
jgi:hypothetical protein